MAKRLRVATVATVAIGLVGFASPAHAAPPLQPTRDVAYADAVPGLAPADIGDRARYVDENGRLIDSPTSTAPSAGVVTALLGCQPESLPDNPHWSSPDVSGHGQWNKGTCTANTAHVKNCLYEYYTDATWRRKACSERVQLKPKSVSNNRTTARRKCDSTGQSISWRNHVDVDVDGQVDNSDVPYRQANVMCVVTGPDA
jgi:hypothetical protein